MCTTAVFLPDELAPTPEQLAGWLRGAWQQGDLARVRFLRAAPAHRQLVLRVEQRDGS
jgi:hypothetical protein